MAKVTVVIPFYNLGDFLDEAVNSVLAQTYKDWELFIVNDGSTDQSSIEKFKSYETHSDKRIKTLSKENEKLPATRNHGIEQSSGEYICCLDADDRYAPEFLEKCVTLLDSNSSYGFVTTWLSPFGAVEGDSQVFQIKKDTALFFLKNVVHVASMFRKKAWEEVGGYDESMINGYEDWDFWLSILEKGYDWNVVESPLFEYRVRKDSMLRSVSDKEDKNYEYILEKHKAFLESRSVEEILKSGRRILFEYDQLIYNLNVQNTELSKSLQDLKNSRLYKLYSAIKGQK